MNGRHLLPIFHLCGLDLGDFLLKLISIDSDNASYLAISYLNTNHLWRFYYVLNILRCGIRTDI